MKSEVKGTATSKRLGNTALESRDVHTDRVESNQVCASTSGFLVLFEQRASKEVYSDGEHACFARDCVEKEVAS